VVIHVFMPFRLGQGAENHGLPRRGLLAMTGWLGVIAGVEAVNVLADFMFATRADKSRPAGVIFV